LENHEDDVDSCRQLSGVTRVETLRRNELSNNAWEVDPSFLISLKLIYADMT